MKKIKSIVFAFMIMFTSLLALSSCKNDEHVHSYEWKTTVQSTCENKGEQEGICSCGHIEKKEIPAKGHYYIAGICTDCGKKE